MSSVIELQACQAFLFDVDGTLIESRVALAKAWGDWADAMQITGDDRVNILENSHGKKVEEYMFEVLSRNGKQHDPEFLKAQATQWFDMQLGQNGYGIDVIPGAVEFFNSLPNSSIGIFTATRADVARERLAAVGFHVDNVVLVGGDDVSRGKPHPEGYLKAAAQLETPTADCIVFEDAKTGIDSGNSAGMTVVALRGTTDEERLMSAHVIVDDFASLTYNTDTRSIQCSNATQGNPQRPSRVA